MIGGPSVTKQVEVIINSKRSTISDGNHLANSSLIGSKCDWSVALPNIRIGRLGPNANPQGLLSCCLGFEVEPTTES